MKNIELLAPAGDLEKLRYALHYGADAVYMAGEAFGLRQQAKNFTREEMKLALKEAHSLGKKLYLVLNIIPHNEDLRELRLYLEDIKELAFDAYILSDPGTLLLVREILGDVEIHLSTQANTTNALSARFWHSQGVKRIILARELSLVEIKEIVEANKDLDLDFEIFVHGAMCISYSGRCLISNFLTGRDANKGDCAQSCRWNYHLMEERRPGEYFPVFEDEKGTYLYNSKDLCGIDLLKEILDTGVVSLKIEGRNKSIYYVASIVRAYKEGLRRLEKGQALNSEDLFDDINRVSHRDFTQGFFLRKPTEEDQLYEARTYVRTADFLAVVLDYDEKTKYAKLEQRNKFELGDQVEFIGPDYKTYATCVQELFDKDWKPLESAPHPQQILYIYSEQKLQPMDLMRKKF
ncbi:MAG: U32 family peptidase [Tissierellia bacterium]|nr:U32 family peptidase [Tissierellia bacterium]